QAAYEKLHPEQRLRFVLNVAREIVRRDPRKEERLKDALRRTGWSLVGGNLIPLAVMALEDLEQVPNAAHKDLSKAADRLGHDLTGAISAACGAVDSLTAEIYESHG